MNRQKEIKILTSVVIVLNMKLSVFVLTFCCFGVSYM